MFAWPADCVQISLHKYQSFSSRPRLQASRSLNELVPQATPCVAAGAAGKSAAVAGAHRGDGPADVAEVAAVLLECSWIGRACVRRLAPKGDPAERPRRAHEICHVRREQVGVKIVRHNGLSGSALCNLLGVGIWSRTTRTCKAENRKLVLDIGEDPARLELRSTNTVKGDFLGVVHAPA